MSIEARQALVDHPHTFFQAQSQRDDLLDPAKTQTELIALLAYLVGKGHIIEFTAVRSDHHDDSELNPIPPHTGTHAGGFAADCWPLATAKAGDYLDAADKRLRSFLVDAQNAPCYHQTGLAGSAFTPPNMMAAGPEAFEDDGADHIHLGCRRSG